MKKLPIFERTDYGDPYLRDSVVVRVDNKDVVATWQWDEEFDLDGCSSFFKASRDIIMKLGAPYNYCDEAERLFLLGCSFGHASTKYADTLATDILDVIEK